MSSVLATRVDTGSETYTENRSAMLALLDQLGEQLAAARAGGGERYVARHRYVDSPLGYLALRERRGSRCPVPTSRRAACTPRCPARSPGVMVAEGGTVRCGGLFLRVEALKMGHPVIAPHDGTVAELRVTDGQIVAAGDVLAVLDEV